MTEKEISEKILKAIKDKKIVPKPRWQFLLRDYFILGLNITLLIIGSLAFSVIIYLIKNNDWDVYEYINDSLLQFALLTLPYFWIVFLAVFIVAAHYNFKHTKKGYKYHVSIISLGSVMVSVALGTILFNVGAGQAIDNVFAEKVPYYEKAIGQPRARWIKPDKGFLAGKVISFESVVSFQIIDLESRTWQVRTETYKIHPRVIIEIGRPVKMIGRPVGEFIFEAERIMPPRPRMHHWFKGHKPMIFEKMDKINEGNGG